MAGEYPTCTISAESPLETYTILMSSIQTSPAISIKSGTERASQGLVKDSPTFWASCPAFPDMTHTGGHSWDAVYTSSREILKGGRILDQALTCSLRNDLTDNYV